MRYSGSHEFMERGHNVNHFLKEVGRELPYLIYFPLKEIEY
jgi:hypothetical protein